MIAFEVQDMSCGHCVKAITEAVKELDAQASVNVDLGTRRVEVESSQSAAALQAAITEAGYAATVAS